MMHDKNQLPLFLHLSMLLKPGTSNSGLTRMESRSSKWDGKHFHTALGGGCYGHGADYNHSFRLDWLHSSSSLSRRLSRHLHLQQQIHQHSQHQYISAANQEIMAGDKFFRTSDLQQQSMMMGPSKGNHIANIPKYPAVPSLCRNVLLLYSPSNNSLNCKSAIHLR
nr:hypothetical protein Iba_chr12aCG15370 [Ipomoea batatas]